MPAVTLQYASRDLHPSRRIPQAIFPILLIFAHVNLCWQLSQLMIAPVCWAERLDFSVWTPLAWIPGMLLVRHAGPIGVLLMILPSILAGGLFWDLITRFRNGLHPLSLSGARRSGAVLLLWACWIPIPATYSVAFLFSRWVTNSPG